MRTEIVQQQLNPWQLATLAELHRRWRDRVEARQEGTFAPDVDVCCTAEALVVTVDLPGVERKNLEISLDFNRLVIHGRRPREPLGEGEILHGSEAPHGSFVRSLTLPNDCRSDESSAELKNGVLTITVPLAPESRSRAIPIARR
jgi:HSP20 family protein